MAGGNRESVPGLISDLLNSPEQFDFHQAVRLIELAVAEQAAAGSVGRVGHDHPPAQEATHFRALPSLTFPPGQISRIDVAAAATGATAADTAADQASLPLATPVSLTVPFLGLTGPAGVLPAHYTSFVIERCHHRNKDYALRDFLDLFNHRVISFFHRAWEKYRFTFAYERFAADPSPQEDLFTECLYSIVGLGAVGLNQRFQFDDHCFLFYGGIFADRRRSAASLHQLLHGFFGLDACVQEFIGQWLYLPESVQSRFPDDPIRNPGNMHLGQDTVVGSRVWDVQSRFRIRIGPLDWREFLSMLPGRPRVDSLVAMTRFYVGTEFDFEIQLILKSKDIPSCRLSDEEGFEPRLGWTTWLGSRAATGQDADDAVFVFRFAGDLS
jgi:type VI secretion system protein ImpH